MYCPPLAVFASTAVLCVLAAPRPATAALIVDFAFDDNGAALGNGQIIDTEFFTRFTITSPETGTSHLGPTIFDSTSAGPNAGGHDRDLLVDLGNILILQNTAYSSNDGFFFDVPNDEADFNPLDFGTVVFAFEDPVELLSIDLIDIDRGAIVDLTLTDSSGKTRTYHVPERWTYDIASTPTANGYDTLDLTTLADQVGEAGGTATASEMIGFDPLRVAVLEFRLSGCSPSAALDNLSFVPGPPTLLIMLAALANGRRRRR